MIRRFLPLILLQSFVLSTALADAPPLAAQLAEIDAAAATVKDLSASFEQRKLTTLLKKPLISSGTVRCVGSTVRWDTDHPQPCVLYADGSELRLYYPQDKLEEIYPIDQRLGDLLSSPVPRLSVMQKHFKIERAGAADVSALFEQSAAAISRARSPTIALKLTPTDPALTQHVRQVLVVLDIRTALAIVVQTIDADGDRTEMIFSNAKVNTGIDPRTVELSVPSNTTLSHPLEGAPPAP
jgi:outer membrane lipoprotein-sorting protein